MTAPPLIVTGHIRTMDPDKPEVEAVAILGGEVVATGTLAEAQAACPAGTAVLDAPGTVVPGLIDSHVHMLWEGREREELALDDAGPLADLLGRIETYAAEHPHDGGEGWLSGTIGVDIERITEGRLPTIEELDAVTAGRPLFLDRRSHDAVVNTAALRLAGVGPETPDPEGGVIERDASGAPTGLLVERPAASLVQRVMPPPTIEDRRRWLRDVQPHFLSLGITGVVDPALDAAELAGFQASHAAGELVVRTIAMPLADETDPEDDPARRITGLGVKAGFGDDRLRLGAVKLFFDGGGSLGTALLHDPWPGQGDYRGNQTASTARLRNLSDACAAAGWGLGVHVVGEAAIGLALDAFESTSERIGPLHGLGFHLIHAYLWPTPEDAERCRRLGVLVATQPPLQWSFGPNLVRRVGAEATARAHPMRMWLDSGATVGGGSDNGGANLSPQWGMWQARTRMIDGYDEPFGLDQAITAEEALALYTTGAAAICGTTGRQGVLKPGALGDLAALQVDPLTDDPKAQRTAGVHLTIVGGEIVHDAR
jgi:predicted amidohydrolase YtcJ